MIQGLILMVILALAFQFMLLQIPKIGLQFAAFIILLACLITGIVYKDYGIKLVIENIGYVFITGAVSLLLAQFFYNVIPRTIHFKILSICFMFYGFLGFMLLDIRSIIVVAPCLFFADMSWYHKSKAQEQAK